MGYFPNISNLKMRKTFFGIDLFIFELMFCRILHALTSFSRYFTSTHSQACRPGRKMERRPP
jgi:hypothetical protein